MMFLLVRFVPVIMSSLAFFIALGSALLALFPRTRARPATGVDEAAQGVIARLDDSSTVAALAFRGLRDDAIREVRRQTGCTQGEARRAVEQLERELFRGPRP